MLVKYQNRIMALPMLCMIIIVLSACCFDEQKNETSNVNPKVQSVETVSVTRGHKIVVIYNTKTAHITQLLFRLWILFYVLLLRVLLKPVPQPATKLLRVV